MTMHWNQEDQKMARLFRAVAHPARVRILRLLAQRRMCICAEIVDGLPLAQATVSQHLKVLREAGLIEGQTEGPAVCYCLAPQALSALAAAATRLASEATEATRCDTHCESCFYG